MKRISCSLLLTLLILAPSAVSAQTQRTTVDVFLDCQTWGCDQTHIRNEIDWVNWVRDRTAADVHLLITAQGAGGGGMAYELLFIGLRSFAADTISLSLQTQQQQTDAERRDLLTNRIAQGVLYFASRTIIADRIAIQLLGDEDAAPVATAADDPWNFWVFGASLQASIDGESREDSEEYEVSVDADRITAASKIELRAEGSYEKDRFQLSSGDREFVTKNWQLNGLAVRALASRWSAGAGLELGRSTFQNQRLYARPSAILEYSFLPYEDFTRRQFVVRYSLGSRYADYFEQTIYERSSEQRFDQELVIAAEYRQPWGSAQGSISGAHYLHDFDRNRVSVDGRLNLRLFRGFSLDVNGNYSRVHDQLYIPAGDLDDEEILLRRQALETNYRYRTSVGIRYTFGSVYNNAVNPRVRRGGGGGGRF